MSNIKMTILEEEKAVEFPLPVKCVNPEWRKVYFAPELTLACRLSANGEYYGKRVNVDDTSFRKHTPLADIQLEIEAGDGTEEVRVVKHSVGNYFLRLAPACLVRLTTLDSHLKVGEVVDMLSVKPLPKGTITKITIRPGKIESVEFVEPEPKYPKVLKNGAIIQQTFGPSRFKLVTCNGEPADMTAESLREALAHIESE